MVSGTGALALTLVVSSANAYKTLYLHVLKSRLHAHTDGSVKSVLIFATISIFTVKCKNHFLSSSISPKLLPLHKSYPYFY